MKITHAKFPVMMPETVNQVISDAIASGNDRYAICNGGYMVEVELERVDDDTRVKRWHLYGPLDDWEQQEIMKTSVQATQPLTPSVTN